MHPYQYQPPQPETSGQSPLRYVTAPAWHLLLVASLTLAIGTPPATARAEAIQNAKHQGEQLIREARAEAGVLLSGHQEEAKRLTREASIESSLLTHDASRRYRQEMRRIINDHRAALAGARRQLRSEPHAAAVRQARSDPSTRAPGLPGGGSLRVPPHGRSVSGATGWPVGLHKRRAMEAARRTYLDALARAKAIRAEAAAQAAQTIADAKQQGNELVSAAQRRQGTLVELAGAVSKELKQVVGYLYNPETGAVTARYEDAK